MEATIRQKVRDVAVLLGSVLGLGTAGYMWVEGWSAFDSLWMTVITLATVGYGEVAPLSTHGRVFTIVLIVLGMGVTAYAFSQLTAIIVEGDLSSVMRRKKMEKKIRELEQHFIICGLGHTGRTVLGELESTKRPLVIVERDPERAAELEASGHMVVQGDALHDETLLAAGIAKARGLFCVLDNDPDNLLLALSARELNPKARIVSELHEPRLRGRLLRCGADAVVSSPHTGRLRLPSEMLRPVTVGFLDSMIRDRAYTYRFEEVALGGSSALAGRAVSKLELSGGRGPAVVAVKENASENYLINPPPDRVLAAGDVLVVLGSTEEIKRLKDAA